jgi:UDP-N-acetylmuramoylalanine-D-glutamate ligase
VMNLLGYGATTLPGRIALFFKRDILAKLSHGVTVIVITGTNGKTTSARMVQEGLTKGGPVLLYHRSGPI